VCLFNILSTEQCTTALYQVWCAIEKSQLQVPMLSCGFGMCTNRSGTGEAGLITSRRGVVCSGCGVVRYCSPACARLAWPAHRKVCGRLAAALGRPKRANNNSSSSGGGGGGSNHAVMVNSSSSTAGGASEGTGPDASGAPPAAQVPVPAGSSQSSARVIHQEPATTTAARVCAWCGAASQQLLRCGRCKAAWYCGADHQRAAWRAGHKQECGRVDATAAAAAMNSASG
jgi:hypothetical protein